MEKLWYSEIVSGSKTANWNPTGVVIREAFLGVGMWNGVYCRLER